MGMLAFGLSALLAAPVVVHAKVRIGTLAGMVVDAGGKPVADATVTIQTSDGLHPHATHTDVSGHFAFARFEIGQYDVRAYAHGVFSDWAKRLYVGTNKTKEVTLRLPVTAAAAPTAAHPAR
jgi:hypothetical protein